MTSEWNGRAEFMLFRLLQVTTVFDVGKGEGKLKSTSL